MWNKNDAADATVEQPFDIADNTIFFDIDFFLSSFGQQSDQAETTKWCSQELFTELASVASNEYVAGEGFNYKTKCTW